MDLLGGVVVHAKRGMRDEYRPVESALSPTAKPVDMAKALYGKFGFRELYIADLNAIMRKDIRVNNISMISEATPMEIMIDAGIDNLEDARRLIDKGISKIIVATETLADLDSLSLIIDELGSKRVVSSLDMKDQKVLSKSTQIARKPPTEVAKILEDRGVSQLIVLELTRVGSESGVDKLLAESIVNSIRIPVITGGGVRNLNDLRMLKEIGIDGVLLATSLHNGSITPVDLRSFITADL
jgi:phosphoribosylformimino-5-aminoimidazole carboxamide ribotide isomerase